MGDTSNYEELLEKLLQQESSEELMKLRLLLMLRTALEGDVRASRIPTPSNITEVGGYYNLLAKQQEKTMQRQLISSALGLPSDYAPEVTEEVIGRLVKELFKS